MPFSSSHLNPALAQLRGEAHTHLYPMSVVAEQIEAILEDGVASPEELDGLKQFLRSILPV